MTENTDIQKLFAPVINLKNVGLKTVGHLARLGCNRIIDLIWHFPSNIIEKHVNPNLSSVEAGSYIIATVFIDQIDDKNRKFSRSKSFKIQAYNSTGHLELVFFNYYPHYIINASSSKITIAGRVERFGQKLQISHPEIVNMNSVSPVEVIYPLTYGINNKQLVKFIHNAIEVLPIFPEWLDIKTIKDLDFPSFKDAIVKSHHPMSLDDLDKNAIEYLRLAYDEILANQLSLGLIRIYKNKTERKPKAFMQTLFNQLLDNLEFKLTKGQEEILADILRDQRSPYRMARLVQGDVGSGKTVIALLAALNMVEAGAQVTIMAPTEILANQHYKWITHVTSNLGVSVELLTGKIKGKKRQYILEDLENGKIDILIGTHAVFQETVKFKNLALIIIDEQHRFGVEQRIALSKKGDNPDILFMSATPIPRTLTLTMSGDLDISRLTSKPIGRLPILTSLISKSKIKNLLNSLDLLIQKGGKAYWICPLIEEQEKDPENFQKDLAAAIARYNEFNILFPGKVGLIHGRMKPEEKEEAMNNFNQGNIQLLIATTVIEVGIDAKDASVIVIEQAERFGLSQLHQLRGRVGRGTLQSYCILLYDTPISINARARLNILKETEDGFLIAEEDLKIRGAGEILGTKQSGLIRFKVADINLHQNLVEIAKQDADNILRDDPKLLSERGRALRNLLKLFEYNDQIDYLFG